ncbi:DUF6443 domain-containing protein [Flavivirga abyssicola]|uniref:DUF6443 domain-containing protein n=1 Tax=Flavivirga abyssicola TaxID=3063533 RepID=UPI0026E0669D|nr:DUF6443 domain-containing protein [Flavivirga sp. MEBiC07777]WVK14523.1 DUF6443 domain-containing protein [Flavivirga sp. MEBiC07777]
MKKLLYILAVTFVSSLAMGQSITENYIKSTIYRVKTQDGITKTNTSINLAANDKIESVTYYDGLGRPIQSIAKQTGGNSEDIITHMGYDEFGRQTKEYLPFAEGSGSLNIRTGDVELATQNFYNTPKYENTLNPYSEKHLEASPLGRILEQGAPGADWAVDTANDTDHTIKFEYTTNTVDDYVRHFNVSFPTGNTEAPQLVDEDVYAPSELYKTITKDENWQPGQTYPNDHTTEEYKDKQGRVVLKRTYDAGKWHDTYYIFDDFGNLTYVLPPKLNTYKSIIQNYLERPSKYYNITNAYVNSNYTSTDIYVYMTDDSGKIYFSMDESGIPNSPLKTGKIVKIDYALPLPDMDLGEIEYYDYDNADRLILGTAYISNGDLYFNSNGTVVPTYGEFYFTGNLNNSQASFSPNSITQSDLDTLGYQYKYDHRNRLIEKRIPGKGWEYIVYNRLDQPVLTQDANLRDDNKWLFTKYDAFGRVAYTGLHTQSSAINRSTMQNLANNISTYSQFVTKTNSAISLGGTSIYYSNDAIPTGISEIYTVNYYDNYTFDKASGNSEDSYGVTPIINAKGLATGSKVRVLNTDDWITTVNYYDDKSRPIYVYSFNDYLNTTDKVKSKLSFTGQVFETTTTHSKTGQNTITTTDYFDYDHAGRLIKQTQQINSNTEVIAENHYDEFGQLTRKGVGGKTAQGRLQNVDYTYNIRGWLKTINNPTNLHEGSDLFAFGLNYNNPQGPTTSTSYNKPLYNGNISHAFWKTDNIDSELRHYTYNYDALNRFTKAYYAENHSFNRKYNSYIYKYDRNGNIEKLSRNMQNPNNINHNTAMDNLTYAYNGNQLCSVTDSYGLSAIGVEGFKDGNTIGDDYMYDANGNMIEDKNKGITSISYNHLNLPTQITIFNDIHDGTIQYIYDANGIKLKKTKHSILQMPKTTLYSGNYIYEGEADNETLKFFNQPEGYAEPDASGGFDYVYQYKDHLGNVRLSYKDSNGDGYVTGGSSTVFYDSLDNNSSSGWDSVGALYGISAQLDNEHSLSGDTSIKIHANSEGSFYAHSNDWIPINNSVATDYIFSGWFYAETSGRDNGSWVSLSFFMNEDTETGYFTEVSEVHHIYTKDRWVYLEQRVTVPTNIDKINLRVNIYNNGSTSPTSTAWFDNLSIRKANDPATVEILEENNYYPFGLKHKGYNYNINGVENKYHKYNGKEYEEALSLDMYEFDWRGYDAAIGRFNTVDPLAELYPQLDKSPYAFAWNNPIVFNDPSGLCPDCPDPSTAKENDIYTIANGSQYIFNGTEWERYTVEELDEVVVVGTSGGSSNNSSSSGEVSQGFVGPGLSPIVPLPGTQPVPTPTAPKVGPGGGGNVGLAVLLWAILVDTAPHPDETARVLDPDDYTNKPRDETSVMRFQFQQGTTNIASTVARNSAETGVTVNQAQVGLDQLYNQQYRKVMTSFVARAALSRLRKKVNAARPYGVIAGTRTTLQEKFIYQGKVYRFDAESIIGHNLRQ